MRERRRSSGRREFALHQGEGRIGADATGIGVGIFLPGADGFEREESGADVGEHHLAIAAGGLVEAAGGNGLDATLEVFEVRDPRVDFVARVVFELGVVLVIAGERADGGLVGEVHLVEVLVGDFLEVLGKRIWGLCRDSYRHAGSE